MQVSYGFGSIAFGIGGVPLSSALLMLYFNQVIGLEAVLVGIAIMVSVSVDAFTDPLIGWVSDRLRSPFGRLVAGAILSLVAFPTQAVPGTVDPGILSKLALIQVTIVVLFNLASIAFFARYNLTREDHERNAAILAARRVAERSSSGG